MSNFNEAADAIRRASKLLEGFKLAAEALDSIGSVDNAAKEAQKALDTAKKQKVKADEALADVTAKVQAVKDEAVALVATAKGDCAALLAKAEADAKRIANSLVDEAMLKTTLTYNKIEADKAKAQDELEKLSAKITESTQASSILDVEVALKQKQLDSLNASLDKLKAKLG